MATTQIEGCGHLIDGNCYHSAIIPGISCARRCRDDNCPEAEDEETYQDRIANEASLEALTGHGD